MSNNLLIKNLKVSIGPKRRKINLFDNFNFEFKANNIYFIMGKSGVGKTTLISYFNGLKKSDQGLITINEKINIDETKRKIRNYKEVRKEVGFLFQYPIWQLCKENVLKDTSFGPMNFKVKKQDAISLASQSLIRMGIDQTLFTKSIYNLSNGQQKRVAIAGVIAINPSIYLFDEPSAGLDANGKREFINLANEFKKEGKIVIIVSHDVELAFELADEILVLGNNKIICNGNPYDVFNNSKIKDANLLEPKLIEFVNKLKSNKKIYNKILELKPRTLDALLSVLKPISDTKGGR